MHFDFKELIQTYSYFLIFPIVFAESGLLIGFFLPGDSLLFTAGFLASQGFLNIWILAIGCFICAVLGDSVGYSFGHKVGRRLFKMKESFLFNPKHLDTAEKFYEKHGKKTIILARFVPVVRTFAPIVAGIGRMEYKTFFAYNVVGGFLWGVLITLLGYFLGHLIPDVDKYLLPILAVIIVASIAPTVVHLLQERKHSSK
ncbi:VTT domain-containing protein [Candidatus Microgenomates bacterium]|nr:VTT domain-containing protein [Candidatus Microgenomates bacterium]